MIIPNTNNKNESRKSYIWDSCCWQIVLPNMFMCKLLHAVLPLTSTKLNIVVIIFRTLSVSTIWMLSGVRGWNFVYGRTAFVTLSLEMKCSYSGKDDVLFNILGSVTLMCSANTFRNCIVVCELGLGYLKKKLVTQLSSVLHILLVARAIFSLSMLPEPARVFLLFHST